MSARQAEAAHAVIRARDNMLRVEVALQQERQVYANAEAAYFEAMGEDKDDRPFNALVDGVMIIPAEDWYDLSVGKRLTFHTIKVTA